MPRSILGLCCGMQDLLVVACGVYFPDQGLNPGRLHWELRVPTTGPPGKSFLFVVGLRVSNFSCFFFFLVCKTCIRFKEGT